MLLGLVHIFAIIGIGLRRYDGTMRMVSTSSLAISAACHVLEEDKEHGYTMPLRWAVVKVENGVGHCTFTTAPYDQIRKPRHILYR